jgi:uncharacterized membrane-anchored protein YhcB (DUF1043 family)
VPSSQSRLKEEACLEETPMAAKKSTKATKKPQKKMKKPSSRLSLNKKKLVIEYADSHDLLDKLLTATQAVSRFHTHALLTSDQKQASSASFLNQVADLDVPDVLGPQRAYDIVTGCAGETDLSKKLSEIPALIPAIFQTCVQEGVTDAGYVPGNVPAAASTTLWEVVQAIQGCGK